MKRISLILILILFLLSLISPFSNAKPSIKTFNIRLFKDGQLLNKPLNILSFWFEIKPGISIGNNNFVEIKYSYSETLLSNESFITVALNGYPLKSRSVFAKGSMPVSWRVYIPKSRIKVGFNELSIITRQRSINGLCKDIDNDSNWIIIHNHSFLHLEVYDTEYSLSYYPYPFLEYLSNNPSDFTFYLPKDFTQEELEAILEISSGLGVRSKNNNLYLKVSTQDPYSKDSEKQILVGEIQRWKTLSQDESFKDLKDNQGLLYLYYTKHKLQLYVSGGKEGLSKAVSYINNPKQILITEKNPVIITSELKEEAGKSREGVIRLRDLGYESIVLSGAFQRASSFLLKIPPGFSSISSGSFIELHFRHSKLLEPNKSSITVYINGKPAKSERLSPNNAENGILRISFPKDELNKREWFIEIKTYHSLIDADCNKKYDEIAWTKIEGDSLIYLVKGWEEFYPDLKDLWKISYRENIVFWFPEKPSDTLLSLSATLSAKIGQISGNKIKCRVLMSDKIDEETIKDADIIFLGDMKDQRINLISNAIWIKPEGNNFSLKRDLGFSLDGFITDALLQVDTSPWGKDKALYSILYKDQDSVAKLKSLLGNSKNTDKFYGQVSIVTKMGKIVSSYLIKERETILSVFIKKPVIFYLIILLIAVLITIVTIMISRKGRVTTP